MSAETLETTTVDAPTRRALPAVVVLGLREARRILRSPVSVVILAFLLATGGLGSVIDGFAFELPSASATYGFVIFMLTLYAGVLTYAAAHLVTSSSRRTGADRQLEASPTTERSRVGAMCLGVVFGPGLVAALALAGLALLGNDLISFDLGKAPLSGVELAQVGLTVVGGGVFGVMVATWLRFPGSLPLGLVVLIMGSVYVSKVGESVDLFRWLAPWVTARVWFDEVWTLAGSPSLHALYLLGLCALAVCGALLHQREGRMRWAVVSAVVLTLTVVAGGTQL